jgi:hypothetical protein
LKEKVLILEEENKRLEENKSINLSLKNEILEIKREKTVLESEFERIKSEKSILETEHSRVEQLDAEILNLKEQMEKEIDILTSEKDKTLKNFFSLKEEMENLNENNSLSVIKYENIINSLGTQINAKEEMIYSLQRNVEAFQKQILNLEESLAAKKKQNNLLSTVVLPSIDIGAENNNDGEFNNQINGEVKQSLEEQQSSDVVTSQIKQEADIWKERFKSMENENRRLREWIQRSEKLLSQHQKVADDDDERQKKEFRISGLPLHNRKTSSPLRNTVRSVDSFLLQPIKMLLKSHWMRLIVFSYLVVIHLMLFSLEVSGISTPPPH